MADDERAAAVADHEPHVVRSAALPDRGSPVRRNRRRSWAGAVHGRKGAVLSVTRQRTDAGAWSQNLHLVGFRFVDEEERTFGVKATASRTSRRSFRSASPRHRILGQRGSLHRHSMTSALDDLGTLRPMRVDEPGERLAVPVDRVMRVP